MSKRYFVVKTAANGITVFLANLKLTNGKRFSSSFEKAFYYVDENKAKEISANKERTRVVDNTEAEKLAVQNIQLAMQSHMTRL